MRVYQLSTFLPFLPNTKSLLSYLINNKSAVVCRRCGLARYRKERKKTRRLAAAISFFSRLPESRSHNLKIPPPLKGARLQQLPPPLSVAQIKEEIHDVDIFSSHQAMNTHFKLQTHFTFIYLT